MLATPREAPQSYRRAWCCRSLLSASCCSPAGKVGRWFIAIASVLPTPMIAEQPPPPSHGELHKQISQNLPQDMAKALFGLGHWLPAARSFLTTSICKCAARWLRISRIDGYAGPLFGGLAPGPQRLTRGSSACSESIAEDITISYPNIAGELVDLNRVTPVGQEHCMLFH